MRTRHLFPAAAAATALILSGCVSSIPDVQPHADAARAIGLSPGEAIVLQTSLPDDAQVDPGLDTSTLSVADVVRLTAQNSPDIQSALARVRVAQADAMQARLLPNPIFNIVLRFPESGTTVIDAGLSADLIAILKRPGATDVADATLRAVCAEAMTVVLDEITRAQELFFTIQSLEATAAVFGERRELIDRLLALAESKLQIGEGTRLDVVTLQTQRIELEAEIAQGALQLRDARLSLARLIGRPSSPADWSLPVWIDRDIPALDETKIIRAALEHRPEVQQLNWELSSLGFEQKLTGWNAWDGTEVGIEAERDGDWSVGPSGSIPIPLFDTGQAQRTRAEAQLTEARHQLTSARRQAIEDVRRACESFAASQENLVRVRGRLLPLQEERLRQAEAQFRAGQTDITGLIIAEHDLRSSRARLIELQREVAVAQLRVERAVGGAGVLASALADSQDSSTIPPVTQR